MAKLFKGQATIARMLACTSLYVVPQALNIVGVLLGYIRCAGGILSAIVSLVAMVWSIVVYIKGVAVANELSDGKAILATILPALVGGVIVLIAVSILMLVGITALAGAISSAG